MAALGFNVWHLPESWKLGTRGSANLKHTGNKENWSPFESSSARAPLHEQSKLHIWLGFSGAVLNHAFLHQSREGTYIFPTKVAEFLTQRKKLFSLSLKVQNLSHLKGEAHYREGFPFSHWALSVISVWGLLLDLISFSEGVLFLQLKWPLLGTKTSMCVGKELTQIVTTANGHCFAFQVTMTPDGKTWLFWLS